MHRNNTPIEQSDPRTWFDSPKQESSLEAANVEWMIYLLVLAICIIGITLVIGIGLSYRPNLQKPHKAIESKNHHLNF